MPFATTQVQAVLDIVGQAADIAGSTVLVTQRAAAAVFLAVTSSRHCLASAKAEPEAALCIY